MTLECNSLFLMPLHVSDVISLLCSSFQKNISLLCSFVCKWLLTASLILHYWKAYPLIHVPLWFCPQVTENGKQEKHLVATVGKFSLIWNFQKVKDSNHHCYRDQEGLKSCYCYKVVLKEESIVDSRFMHENFAGSDSPEAPLVVATPMKVSSFSIANRRWFWSSLVLSRSVRSWRILCSLSLF